MSIKSHVPLILANCSNNSPMIDAWIQWALNPTSPTAGYGLEENYSFIRSNLMERYLMSTDDAEQYVQALRDHASSLITSGCDIRDLRKGIIEEAKSNGIWSKIVKEKLEQSSPDAKKAVYLLLYLKFQGYFRWNPADNYDKFSFGIGAWSQFMKHFNVFYIAAYGKTFSKHVNEELFKIGLWNKLWYKPCRSPGEIEIVMMPFPTLEEFNFDEANTAQKIDVKQLIERLFLDRRFEQLAFIDEVTKAPFGLRWFKQEVPSLEGIAAISEKEGYNVAISPFLLEQTRDQLNSCKQELILDLGEKIEKALTQLCEEKWPECERTCKAKGQQSLWRIDSANYSPLYVYLAPWLTEADVNTLFPDKGLSAIFIVLTQSIPAIKQVLFNKITAFRYLEILSPSGGGFQCWKVMGERFGYTDRIIELIGKVNAKSNNNQNPQKLPSSGSETLSVEKLGSEKMLPILLSQDEGQRLEFKSSLRYDVKASEHGQDKINPDLEKEVLREVCAFLNSDGGTLLIGVSDDKKVLGLKDDYRLLPRKQNRDEFEGFLRNKLTQNVQPDIPGLVKITFEAYGNEEVCMVEVEKSGEPMFLKEFIAGREIQELWIREGNRKRPLVGAAMANYISRHRNNH